MYIYLSASWLQFSKVIEALKSGTATLSSLNSQISIESVEDVMDDLNEVSNHKYQIQPHKLTVNFKIMF